MENQESNELLRIVARLWRLSINADNDTNEDFREPLISEMHTLTNIEAALDHMESNLGPKSSLQSKSSKLFCRKLMRRALVLEAEKHVKLSLDSNQTKMIKAVKAVSPARIDLAGGWSDTPPICVAVGGRVTGVAITVDHEKPIGSKASRLDHLELRLISLDSCPSELMIRSMDELVDFADPSRPMALLKASIVCCLQQKTPNCQSISLEKCLEETIGSGLLLETWSNLPSGSGLGTSSILATTILASILTLMKISFEKSDLIHLALVVEQMLSTGGGWQDQVHGIMGGFQVGFNIKGSLKVDSEVIKCGNSSKFGKNEEETDDFDQFWSNHLMLVYTGKSRLAKNILEDVLTNWFSESSRIEQLIHDDIKLANVCKNNVANKNVEGLADCLNKYWAIKKELGGESVENEDVAALMKKLENFVQGACLAGAGGGGFLVLVLKSPCMRCEVERVCNELQGVTAHSVQVDYEGLVIEID